MELFGQDLDVVVAVFSNILSWVVASFVPYLLPALLPRIDAEDDIAVTDHHRTANEKCIAIGRPGGLEQLRTIHLKPGYATRGYNVILPSEQGRNCSSSPFVDVTDESKLPPGTIVLKIYSFSVNYADCCIRWGLYNSANKFVGWPIVPGFDISGVVEKVVPSKEDTANSQQVFQVGDRVYGATFFGAYSTRCLVPAQQLRKIPQGLSFSQAASIPAVSITALYSLYLGGAFPSNGCVPNNRSILIHSAAGGVGSMMVQMSKMLGMSPVVGVVGRTAKVEAVQALGCDVVVDKSQQPLWMAAKEASPEGYAVIADANGFSTLQSSMDHLAQTGRLVVFGFHSNLPMGQDMLNPFEWIKMIIKMVKMPRFDAMDLVVSNKSILGFNLSFFVKELGMLSLLYDQIGQWLADGELHCPRVTEMNMKDIAKAHQLLQSGKTVGKLVMIARSEDGNVTQ